MKNQSQNPITTRKFSSTYAVVQNEDKQSCMLIIPASSEDWSEVSTANTTELKPPGYFPSIVIRLNHGLFCYFPVYISPFDSTVKEYVAKTKGKHRELVVKKNNINNSSYILKSLLTMTKQESMMHGCKACLCLTSDKAYYYDPEQGDFNEQQFVPRTNNWLNDEDYMNLIIYHIDTEGNRYERRMHKAEALQSYFLGD